MATNKAKVKGWETFIPDLPSYIDTIGYNIDNITVAEMFKNLVLVSENSRINGPGIRRNSFAIKKERQRQLHFSIIHPYSDFRFDV